MIADELTYQILQAFGFAPTAEQAAAIGTFCRFLIDRDDRVAMILRGSAGTGKTTLAGAMVKALAGLHQRMVLLAPTGARPRCFRSGRAMPHTPFTAASTGRSRWTRRARISALTSTNIPTRCLSSMRRR